MPKSSKTFILSTSGINCYGFRLLTSGADLEDFKANPIMLWMHNRATRGTKDEVLPLGYWDDVKIEGDTITAIPFFDDSDPYAMSIYHKVENGTIRSCSAGAVPVEWSEDPELMLPGQTLPTVAKWKMKEASLVDFGANAAALAVALYDMDENLINLSDNSSLTKLFAPNLNPNMKFIQLSAAELAVKLSLKEEASAAEAMEAISNIIQLNGTLKADKDRLTTEMETLQGKLVEKENEAKTIKIHTLVDKAIEDRKITTGQRATYINLAEGNYDAVKNLFDGMQAAPTVQAQLSGSKGEESELDKLTKLSWDELHKSGKLEMVKANHAELYKTKFTEKFGKESIK